LSGGGILQAGEGNPPVDDSYPDPCAGLAVGTAVVMGLLARERTGESQYVETNMLCSTGYAMSRHLVTTPAGSCWPLPDHGQHGFDALRRLYRCREGWLMLEVHRETEWLLLARALDREQWLADPRFSSPARRAAHDAELAGELARIFSADAASAWEARLARSDVAAVRADEETFPAFVTRQGLGCAVSHPAFGSYWRLPARITFARRAVSLRGPAAVGEHGGELMQELDA
jgi:crotonobetainyl-CoA:carnitine CoA-transferase CaiB-like acyl-CoA transferase